MSRSQPARKDSSSSLSSVDSLSAEAVPFKIPQTSISPLTAGDGLTVPANTIIYVTRNRKKEQGPRGFTFFIDENQPASELQQSEPDRVSSATQAFFASVESWIAKASRPEIIFKRKADDVDTDQLGTVNFHHWLANMSNDVIVTIPGNDFTANLERSTSFHSHSFEFPLFSAPEVSGLESSTGKKKLYWKQTRGVEGTSKEDQSRMHRNLKCVDEDDNVWVSYTRTSGGCFCRGGSSSNKKQIGRLRIHQDGLTAPQVEFLAMTFLAVYVKCQKRVMQGSMAGVASGTVTLGMFVVLG